MTTATLATDAIVREICLRAADIMEKRGFTRDAYVDEVTHCVDLEGAVRLAVWPDYERSALQFVPEHHYGYIQTLVALSKQIGTHHVLLLWVQAPGRTQADVVALLRGVGA